MGMAQMNAVRPGPDGVSTGQVCLLPRSPGEREVRATAESSDRPRWCPPRA